MFEVFSLDTVSSGGVGSNAALAFGTYQITAFVGAVRAKDSVRSCVKVDGKFGKPITSGLPAVRSPTPAVRSTQMAPP
jgi:hypothetical protein